MSNLYQSLSHSKWDCKYHVVFHPEPRAPRKTPAREQLSNPLLDAAEAKRLRAVIQADYPEHMPEFDLALQTGSRRGEMFGLTWEDVNFDQRILRVRLSKNAETRHVPLNRCAVDALLALHKRGDGTGSVFDIQKPRHWFEPTIQNAGIKDFTWHCLRHTFASRLVMAGVSIKVVQELMGHKSIQMTCRYAHLAPSYQLAAVDRLADFDGDQDNNERPTSPRTSTEASVATPPTSAYVQ